MSSVYSSEAGSKALVLQSSSRNEVKDVAKIVKKKQNEPNMTICVAREESLQRLEEACRSWGRPNPKTVFSTAQDLQPTINRLKLSPKRTILNILVSPEIPSIIFHVPSHYEILRVLRCNPHKDGRTLDIHGDSTYNNVPLHKWQAHRHKHHKFMINHERGVRINIPGLRHLTEWSRCRDQFSDDETRTLEANLRQFAGETCWERIRASVSAIMGILVGTVKINVGMNGSAGGIYARYTFGLHAIEIGAAGAKINTVATIAGPAVVLGVLTSAAVYFIPWEALFEWLRPALSGIWERVVELWQRFKKTVMQMFSGGEGEGSGERGHAVVRRAL